MGCKQPNFFIIGAPKCGTTALSAYLQAHPRIFIPRVKEPHYFAQDLWQYARQYYKSRNDYLSLFESAPDSVTALGEASVFYAFSDVAIPAIRDFDPDAKLIMMVRNPVDLTYALHGQYTYNNLDCETEPNFEKAWRLQDERLQGKSLPAPLARATDRSAALLQYRLVAQMGDQLERVLKIVPEDQVHVIVFDDFKTQPQAIYEEVLQFLDLPSNQRMQFPQINGSKVRRFATIHAGVKRITTSEPLIRLWRHVKHACNVQSFGIRRFVEKHTTVYQARAPLSPDLRAELMACFRADIVKLESLLGRDFSHWR